MKIKKIALLFFALCGIYINYVFSQNENFRVVEGKVVDETGLALGGAQIHMGSTNIGTVTHENGIFTLKIPQKTVTLQISLIGYQKHDVDVLNTQSYIEIEMRKEIIQLDEVVILGYATTTSKRNSVTGIDKLSSYELNKVPVSRLDQALQGKITGAQISTNSGAPGGGTTVRLRGVTSIFGNFTPIYIVDGVIVSDARISNGTNFIRQADRTSGISGDQDDPINRIADLNPNDIESIEVLKGAAASVLYGSKASSGVIVITTKQGQINSPKYRFSQRLGFSELSNKIGARKFESVQEAVEVFGQKAEGDFIASQGRFFDNEEYVFGNKPVSYESEFSAAGGSEKTSYFTSFLNRHEGGIVENTFADKQSFRINLKQIINNNLSFDWRSQVIHRASDRGLYGNENNGTSLYAALASTPSFYDLRRGSDGTFPENPYARSNPLQTINLFENNENVWRFIGSGRVNLKLLQFDQHALEIIAIGGGDVFTQKNNVISPSELFFEDDDGLPGTSISSISQQQSFTVRADLIYRYFPFSDNITTNTQFGIQYDYQYLDINRIMSQSLIGGQQNIDNGTKVTVEQDTARIKDLGFFGQQEIFTLKNKLLLVLGLRADKSSNNGNPNKLFFYPRIASSYRLLINSNYLEEIKPRIALGYSGNQPRYGQKFTDLIGSNINGLPTTMINNTTGDKDIMPEKQREVELGLDAILLKGRCFFTFTWYEKQIENLLLPRSLAPILGYSTLIFNGGSIRNRGIELTLDLYPIFKKDFRWQIRGMFYRNISKVTKLPVPSFRPNTFLNLTAFGQTFIEEGESCTQIIGFDLNPEDPTGPPIVTKIGDASPDYIFSIFNEFTYKKVSLSFLFDRQKGGRLLNATHGVYDFNLNSPDQIVPKDNKSLSGNERNAAFGRRTSVAQEDASYLKLREVSLSYEIPISINKTFLKGIKLLKMTLGGRNLITWTPFTGLDPEFNGMTRSPAAGNPWELWSYPPCRSYWASFDIHF